MTEREDILRELWKRLASVPTVAYTARNPKVPPAVSQLPCLQFFELSDEVTQTARRGDYVIYHRRLTVVVEGFIQGTLEQSASSELMDFISATKKAIYNGGPSLGKRCSIGESTTGRVLRPPSGDASIGLGIVFQIAYIEDINKLYI